MVHVGDDKVLNQGNSNGYEEEEIGYFDTKDEILFNPQVLVLN